MKSKLHQTDELNTNYNSQGEFNKRNYRLERETKESIASACLRWRAERRYL